MEDKFTLKKILVSLDLSALDEVLIRFASYTARMMDSDQIYFVHVATPKEKDTWFSERKQEGAPFTTAALTQGLEQKVAALFEPVPNCHTSVEVHEGNPIDRLLKLAHEKSVDLIVLGSKAQTSGSGAVGERVVRAAHRSVLLVPEQLPYKMDKVLVPVDFSEHSLRAVLQAIKIQENSPIPLQIICQHVFDLPSGWHTSGKSEEEYAGIMEQHAQKDYQKFIKQLPAEHQSIPCVYTLDNNHDPVKEIYGRAVREQADLIIVGSRGKSAAAAALMGSVAERLANSNQDIPLLIVKDKNENIGFLKALLQL